MGSFVGHVLPGIFFVIWSIWSTVYTFKRYFRGISRNKDGVFTSTTRFSGVGLRWIPLHLDIVLKLVLPVAGILGEAFGSHGIGPNNIQHITMYTAFALHPLSELLHMYRVLPVGLHVDYVSLIIAYTAEALLFAFHVHGRGMLDMQVHTLLVHSIWLCVIATVLETAYRNNVLLPVVRSYGTLLQGLWFIVVAFILYNPLPGAVKWDEDNHGNMMLVTNIFIWVAIGNFVVLSLICWVVKWFVQRGVRNIGRTGDVPNGDSASMELLANSDEWQ